MSTRKGPGRRTRHPWRASRPPRAAASRRTGDSTREEASSVRSPLARLLDAPQLARVVPHLAPELLQRVIRQSGLDACAELVALATPEQVTAILDLDLWRHAQPGRDEQFDVDRFGEWVEALVDAGDALAARTVAGLHEPLVIAGLSRYLRVYDPSAIASPSSIDDQPVERDITPSDGPACEVAGYLVCGIRPGAWDAIVTLLLALESGHPDFFHAVMRGCRRLSNSRPEVDGLDELLMEPEQLLHDVAVYRQERRSQRGYSTPADARAFLQMARQRRRDRDGTPSTNPIAAAYFRAADASAAPAGPDALRLPHHDVEPASTDGAVAEALDAIAGLLAGTGPARERPKALLRGAVAEPSRLTRMQPLMEHVRDTADHAYFTRTRELAFLANTLIAGCSVQGRPFTAQEASDAAAAVCNLGLEHWPARYGARTSVWSATAEPAARMTDAFLMDHDLVTAFEVGWAVLHEDVSMSVAEQLIGTLTDLRCDDDEIQDGLDVLRRELARQREAGTPWRARDALDVLATLDMTCWASLRGLLGECPVLPAALTATIERRAGAVSATAFEFIATSGQIGKVRAFMRRLPDLLGR
jgi:hypothetical protein